METTSQDRTYRIRNSEKCYRFKPDAFASHAPPTKGIYELVTFDDAGNPTVLYVGAAFNQSVVECLEGHALGTIKPTADELFAKYPNLYFDYLTEMGAKTLDDAKDVYWWLVQKHKPPYNDVAGTMNSGRPGNINVEELEG